MFKDWLIQSNLSNDFEDQAFKVEEVDRPDDFITKLAKGYLDANVNPSRVDRKVRRLKNSSRELGLDDIQDLMEEFIKKRILPDKDEKGTKSGLFGEYMSEKTMVQINGYRRFVYKLRHREASNWAPKLIDVCVFKSDDQINLCLIEVKTNSSGTKNNILEKGLESLLKGLKRKYEALMFISRELEKQGRLEMADLADDLAMFDEHEEENELCLVIDPNYWSKKALKKLSSHENRSYFNDLSVRIIFLEDLGNIIEEVHSKALKIGSNPSNG